MPKPMTITGFEAQGRKAARIVVFCDGVEWATLDAETVVREGLGRGQSINASRAAAILATDEAVRARKALAGSIARSPKTLGEGRRYLRGRRFSEAATAHALAALQASGTLDDERVISKFVARKRRKQDVGPARLAAELRARGVEGDEAHRRAREAVKESDLATECEALARKLAPRYQPQSDPRKRQNLAAALMRRGYEGEHVHAALRKLRSASVDDMDE